MPLDGSSSASLKSMYEWMYLRFYKFFFLIFTNLHKALINLIICLILLTESWGGWILNAQSKLVQLWLYFKGSFLKDDWQISCLKLETLLSHDDETHGLFRVWLSHFFNLSIDRIFMVGGYPVNAPDLRELINNILGTY